MKLLIAAVGKLKPGPEQQLFAEYAKRLPWKLDVKEIKPHGVAEEGRALLAATESYDKRVVLDERGKTLSSRELAEQIKAWQLESQSIACLIGGADGVSDEVRGSAHLLLSFGRASWPHMLVRVLLAEQLYRAHTLISGHPYHRD